MTTLEDQTLKGNTIPPEGYLNNYLIDGTSKSIETRLKAIGWDGIQPRASIVIHYESKHVKYVQLVISGTRETGRALATILWGSDFHKDSYVKFESLDLAYPIFINSITSGWIKSSLQCQLKIKNQDTGYYKCIPKSDKQSLSDYNATDINLKVLLQLEKGPKLLGRIGVAPSNDIQSIIGNFQDILPFIQLGEQFPIEFSPSEPEEAGLGLGFIPFLRYSGEGDDGLSEFP